MKVHSIAHVIFETLRSGFIRVLNHCSVSWKITPLYFLAQTLYTLDKKSPSKWNFQAFVWLNENSPNSSCRIWNQKPVFLYVNYGIRNQELCAMTMKNDPKFEEELTCRLPHYHRQNWHEKFDKFWPEHSKVLKICSLIGSFWQEYIMFELKKCRGVIFPNTEEWCKIWRKTDLWFGK